MWNVISITVNQLIFAAIMFHDFMLQDNFAEIYFRDNQNAESSMLGGLNVPGKS